MTAPDRNRRAFERGHGILQDALTLILLRWIAVAAVLLGIAALAFADEVRTSAIGADTRCAKERSR
jgi:hypothetical protein